LAFIIRIYHNARSSECQNRQFLLVHRTTFISAFLLSICSSATLFSHNIYRYPFSLTLYGYRCEAIIPCFVILDTLSSEIRSFLPCYLMRWGTRWRSWLRHCATIRKDTGSIPDDVIRFFSLIYSFRSHYGPWSTQPLTEMSTRNFFWGLRQPTRRADNLTTFICQLS
jgi:hypothetical protein